MKIGIVGLGLIGGSLAKAIKAKTVHSVYGADISHEVIKTAVQEGVLDGSLEGHITDCQIILIALYVDDCIQFLKDNAVNIQKGAVVIDCCGVKEKVCKNAEQIAAEHGFIFIGGHPMAGTECSGYQNSRGDLFNNASMILTPNANINRDMSQELDEFFLELGFGTIKKTTPQEHDKIIAYTSQLAHILSSAYIKSPSALLHRGFSAGSFKDMTRVAYLNEDMWCQLFMLNDVNLLGEIDLLIANLQEYRDVIASANKEKLIDLLLDGKQRKILSEKIK